MTSSDTTPKGNDSKTDPMEEFLAREKAALEALEQVDIKEDSSMQIDEPLTTTGPNSPQSSFSSQAASRNSSFSSPAATRQPSFGSPVMAPPALTSGMNSQGGGIPQSPQMNRTLGSPTVRSTSRPETDAMREWKAERARKVAERDALAAQHRQERQQQAREDIQRHLNSWKQSVEERKSANRSSSGAAGGKKKEEFDRCSRIDQLDWKEVDDLIESLPKPSKDCSRALSIIKSVCEGS